MTDNPAPTQDRAGQGADTGRRSAPEKAEVFPCIPPDVKPACIGCNAPVAPRWDYCEACAARRRRHHRNLPKGRPHGGSDLRPRGGIRTPEQSWAATRRKHPKRIDVLRWALAHGARKVDRWGYIRVTVASGRWEYEHRLVVADRIGRALRRDEHAHHLNGRRGDNRPENLELLPASAHIAHHNHVAPKRKKKAA